ncbi:MAG: PDZ domain-containing protein [Bryobacterales bacterium]|nr:PDZ domain-containing protein [Bryobacterales bacterium]
MHTFLHRLFLITAMLLSAHATINAQSAEPVRHTLRFPDAKNHYVQVESVFPTGGAAEMEVFMAVWTPGSYLVREYARNIDRVEAADPAGNPLTAVKSRKNRWLVRTGGAPSVTLRYTIYCREMTVRTNFVDDAFAMLQGAATYLSPVGENQRPHLVRLELPPNWKQSVSALPTPAGAGANTYLAADYDTLVDSPIVAGNPDIFEFDVRGRKHQIVNLPASDQWDGPKSVAAVTRIVEQFAAMWGELPYEKYVFFNMLVEAGGGLEHKSSTVLMTSALASRSDDAFYGNPNAKPPQSGWLSLVSHEYFHVWNVKRLRPRELGPFDYEGENYTESLWVAEGLTSYYADLALLRAGLIDRDNYLARLSGAIAELQTQPGRLVQSAAESSYDAWIKGYRPDENSPNSGISYYTKGNVMGFLLDVRIRQATGNTKSLDDVMRLAYQRYSGESGYSAEEFRGCVQEVAGAAVAAWVEKAERQTADLDYSEALGHLGLRFRVPTPIPTRESGRERAVRGWTGAETRVNGASVFVTGVLRGTPAFEAGLSADDEILAVGDRRINASLWPKLGEYYHAGETVEMLVSRMGQLIRLPIRLREEPRLSWQLEVLPNPSNAQRDSLDAWLGAR